MSIELNYYRLEDINNFRFYQMPKIFFEDEKFKDLSDGAIILYSLLRDRTELSKNNGWIDEHGRVYIVYTIKAIMNDTHWGNKKAGKLLQELQDYGLIQKYRKTRTSHYRIYVMNICSDSRCQNDTSGDVKTTPREMSKRHPNDTNNNQTERVSYKRAQKDTNQKRFRDNFQQRDYSPDEYDEILKTMCGDTG